MDDDVTPTRFTVERLSAVEWVIRDHRDAANGAGRIVAQLHDIDTEIAVTWLVDVPLPTSYAAVDHVIDDVERWCARSSRSTRPVPIPHFAPPSRVSS